MALNNNETKLLHKLVLWIAVLTAVIAPWIYHDRAITTLSIKIDMVQRDVTELKRLINNSLKESAMIAPDKKTLDKF